MTEEELTGRADDEKSVPELISERASVLGLMCAWAATGIPAFLWAFYDEGFGQLDPITMSIVTTFTVGAPAILLAMEVFAIFWTRRPTKTKEKP